MRASATRVLDPPILPPHVTGRQRSLILFGWRLKVSYVQRPVAHKLATRALHGALHALARQRRLRLGGISWQKRMIGGNLSSNGFVYFFFHLQVVSWVLTSPLVQAPVLVRKPFFTRTLVCEYTTMRALTPTQGHYIRD